MVAMRVAVQPVALADTGASIPNLLSSMGSSTRDCLLGNIARMGAQDKRLTLHQPPELMQLYWRYTGRQV